MWDQTTAKPLTIITGHYGSGKTNLALNIARDIARSNKPDLKNTSAANKPATEAAFAAGKKVILVDLDIVNPYFRTSDYQAELAAQNITVVSPNFAGTTLDAPSLSPAIDALFPIADDTHVIFDVGGDDAGATALGRYKDSIAATDHEVLYVVNHYRNLTAGALQAAVIMREIEAASGIAVTGVVNNSHLQDETTLQTITDAVVYGQYAAASVGLPLQAVTIPHALAEAAKTAPDLAVVLDCLYPIKRYVHTLWETDPDA